jgi:hypothetical protein
VITFQRSTDQIGVGQNHDRQYIWWNICKVKIGTLLSFFVEVIS